MRESTCRLQLRSPSAQCPFERGRPRFRWEFDPGGLDGSGKVPKLASACLGTTFEVEVAPLAPGQEPAAAFGSKERAHVARGLRGRVHRIPDDQPALPDAAGYAWRVIARDDAGRVRGESEVGAFYVLPADFPLDLHDLLCCEDGGRGGEFEGWKRAYGAPILDPKAKGCLDARGTLALAGSLKGGDAVSRVAQDGAAFVKGRRYAVSLCARAAPREVDYVRFRVLAHNGELPGSGAHPPPSPDVAIVGETGRIESDEWTRIVLPRWRSGRDYERVAVLALSDDGAVARGVVSSICVREVDGCADALEGVHVRDGEVHLSDAWGKYVQDGERPRTVDVGVDAGSVRDLLGEAFDVAGNHAWYGEPDPCASIGGTVPEEARELAEEFAEPDLGDGFTPGDVHDAAETIAGEIAKFLDLEKLPPIEPEKAQECRAFEPDETLPFSGRDIVYVHGFRPDHVVGLMGALDANLGSLIETFLGGASDEAVSSRWPEDNATFEPGGWFRTQGDGYWKSHIERHLGSTEEPTNRYLVVGFNSNQRLVENVHAVLHQIARAMSFGEGVVHASGDPRGNRCFGRPCVLVSHSTGALVADVMSTLASWTASVPALRNVFGDALYIPRRIAAHVSLHGAIGGSELASLAVVGANALGLATGAADVAVDVGVAVDASGAPAVTWFRDALAGFGISTTSILGFLDAATDDLAAMGRAAATVANRSILVDLMPAIAKGFWGAAVDATPVPVLTVAGGHPSSGGLAKLVLPGLDDGVVSTSSQSASPSLVHPDRYVHAPPVARVYDMGIAPERANVYFAEQFGPTSTAYGSVHVLSPTGMLQPVALPPTPNPRYRNHYTFLQSASDHNRPTFADTTYEPTASASNFEETLVVEVSQPVLAGLIHPAIFGLVGRTIRGQDLVLRLSFLLPRFTPTPPFFELVPLTIRVVIPLWRRTYDRLPPGRQEEDHVYDFVLR